VRGIYNKEDLLTDQPSVCIDTPRNAALLEEGPSQPRLKEYHPNKFGREKTYRDFNSDWFKMYPWLSYDVSERSCSCFPCKIFMNNDRFKYDNWKKSNRLLKHVQSKCHQTAMAKWLAYRANQVKQTSVLVQLHHEHERQIEQNRDFTCELL
jgi:hypothetical protein